MKNFALIFSSLAVASSAFAVEHQVNARMVNEADASVQPMVATQSAQHFGFGKAISDNSYKPVKKLIQKAPEDAESSLSVSYKEPYGIFALGLSEQLNGYDGFSYRKGPAYTPLTWLNTSVGASEFEWSYIDFNTGGETFDKSVDFVTSIPYTRVDAPILYGMDAGGNSAEFQFGGPDPNDPEGEYSVLYYIGGGCQLSQSQPNLGMTTYMHAQNAGGFNSYGAFVYDTTGAKGYDPATGLDEVYTAPDPQGYGFENVKFLGYANIFGQPAAPYLITKMWCWMAFKANKPTVVEMTLYKINEEGRITDEVLASGEANIEQSAKVESQVVKFDLFGIDEDGLQTDDIVVVDCPFVAIMKLNKDDFDVARSIWGGGALYPANEKSPYARHALMVLDIDGEESFMYSPYSYYTSDELTELMSITDFMWMVDAVFPWLFSESGEVAQVPVEGGNASFDINSYYSIAYFDYSISDDCDWIDFEKATLVADEETGVETLSFPIDALPEGVSGRSASILISGPGTELELTINQGDSNAVSVVASDKNAQYFDLQGRRVANPEKGIYIKKSGNKTEKVIL